MCGIVGIVGDLDRDGCSEIVQRMNAAIVHRGPDDEGVWSEDGFGFGMRRLSIIDLRGGHQPMWDEGTGLGVVFNGEVFNYRHLRDQLIADGYTFKNRSDTEVVVKSLVKAGLQAVHGWNGMFAVAAWDSREKRLLLIRDRMGVKPLYYYWDGTNFLFASEIKAILASGLTARRLNQQSVWDYLTFRYVPGPETIWEGIRKLPPGHALELSAGKAPREICYWQTDVVHTNSDGQSEEQLDQEFAELFLDAVRLRLEASDVPVGVLLSGGLDSSAIAAAAIEVGHRNFQTFTVEFDEGGYYSEANYARKVAQHVGANYHEVVIGQKKFLEMLPEMVYYSDEPLADLSSIPQLAVSRLASHHVKVILSGDGCDEILAGYDDFGLDERRWELVRSLQSLPAPLLKAAATCAAVLPSRYGRQVQRIAEVPLADWYQRDHPHMTRFLEQSEKGSLWSAFSGQDSERILKALYASTRSSEPLQQVLSVFQKSWLVEDILMKADKMSMSTSVELRTPFLDYRLVEWANQKPKSVKVKRTGLLRYETKNILRRFCAKRLPREILTRRKRGFPVPVNLWLANGLKDWAHDMLLGPNSRVSETFSRDALLRLLSDACQGNSDAANDVWLLVVLEFWLRVWNVHLDPKQMSDRL